MDSENHSITLPEIYRFLAQSMHYPDPEWMNADFIQFLNAFLQELHWTDEADTLNTALKSSDNFLEDIQIEHTRLFINAVPHVAAPPYASVYFKGDGTLYGNIAEKTKQFYREKGFYLSKEDDLPDHIVYELEFLALLENTDKTGAQEFLEDLFRPWFTLFYSKVTKEARHPYYRVMMKLIDFFTREEL
ncbi:MAG: molecular chaperone TorD family protein [Desulfobulbaceae bacterium]|nr:molecular chaperone TorD family protein [Desulfobulbaceae bacterium]